MAHTHFSVLIPAFQAEATVKASVESALNQALPPHEVIVCNDGSTDRTGEILTTFGDAITVINKSNGGLSTARNAALAAATGDYVVLLDADDTWEVNRLAAIDSRISETAADIVTTDAKIVDETGVERGLLYAYNDLTFPPANEQRIEILRRNFIFVSAAIRRQLLVDLGGFDVSHREQGEYEAWVRLILAGARAELIDEPLATYLLRSDSLSSASNYNRRVRTLALRSALASGQLSEAEREVAQARLRSESAMDRVDTAAAALRAGTGRRESALVVVTRGVRLGLRLRFLAATAAPRLVAKNMRPRKPR